MAWGNSLCPSGKSNRRLLLKTNPNRYIQIEITVEALLMSTPEGNAMRCSWQLSLRLEIKQSKNGPYRHGVICYVTDF